MITLKQLRFFDAVARLRHFGKAADHCAVTQPALSMQIKELERKLGVELIERRPQGLTLSAAGQEIAGRATRILSEARDLTDFARHRASVLSGKLHFGIIPTAAPYILPPLLPVLRENFPNLELHIRETQTQTLLQELRDGLLDLMLVALPIEHPDIETTKLIEDKFLLAMPQGRRIASHVRATPELMKEDRLLLLEEGHCLRDQALTFCHLRRVDNIDTFGASSLSTLVQMVANGMGLTLLPEISVDHETRHGGIRLMRFAEPEPKRQLGLAWRTTSPRKRDFVELSKLIIASSSKRKRIP